MFTITIKRNFNASHALCGGSSEERHKHNWRLEVQFISEKLDDSGCVIDFLAVDKVLTELSSAIEGKNINELEYFEKISPSTENIAKYIFEKIYGMINQKPESVTLWEDDNHGVTYRP